MNLNLPSKRNVEPATDLFGEPVRRFATVADAAAVSFERELTTPSAVVACPQCTIGSIVTTWQPACG